MRTILHAILLSCVIAALLSCTVADRGVASQDVPHRVIWITIDSLRADHLHYMGYPKETSPWMDSFAEKSVNFRQAISATHVTPRSTAASFTGKISSKLVEKLLPLRISEAETLIAELLHDAGFRTRAWITNPLLTADKGFQQGFDEYRMLLPHGTPHGTMPELLQDVRENYAPSGQREFIYIHTMDVHSPYRPPIPYDRLFAPPYDRAVAREGVLFDLAGRYVFSNLPYYSSVLDMRQQDIEFILSQYDGAIRYMDATLPALLDALAFDPQRDLVIITADHGEQFFDHGFFLHERLLFPEEIHVPLLIRWAGFKPGERTHPASLMDLFPTLAELFNLTPPEGLDGVSLLDSLRGAPPDDRFVISEPSQRAISGAVLVGGGYLYQLEGMAHVFYPWRLWPFIEELYDLNADPGCTRNLASSMPDTANRLNAVLRRLYPRVQAFSPELIRGSDEDVRLGPNLVAPPAKWTLTALSCEAPPENGLRIAFPETLAYTRAPTDEPDHAYLIEVEYELKSGALLFKLQSDPTDFRRHVEQTLLPYDKTVSWCYESRKPTSGMATVRSLVYPRGRNSYFMVGFLEPGEARINAVRLRRAFVPEVHGTTIQPPAEERPAQTPLSPADQARMKALGYLN